MLMTSCLHGEGAHLRIWNRGAGNSRGRVSRACGVIPRGGGRANHGLASRAASDGTGTCRRRHEEGDEGKPRVVTGMCLPDSSVSSVGKQVFCHDQEPAEPTQGTPCCRRLGLPQEPAGLSCPQEKEKALTRCRGPWWGLGRASVPGPGRRTHRSPAQEGAR